MNRPVENQTALAPVTYETESGLAVTISPSDVTRYILNGSGTLTDQEMVMFLNLCKFQRLNPFVKECYIVKYGSGPNAKATIIVGKDVFMKRAYRHPDFDGFEAGIVVKGPGADAEFVNRQGSMVLKGETVVGGWARIHMRTRTVPVYVEVAFEEYVGKKTDGSTNAMWAGKPGTMIRKVALVQALREAFPEDLQGLYGEAEVDPITTEAEPTPPAPPALPEPEIEAVHSDQLDELRFLWEQLAVSEEIVSAQLETFSAETAEDLSFVAAEKLINLMRKKFAAAAEKDGE